MKKRSKFKITKIEEIPITDRKLIKLTEKLFEAFRSLKKNKIK